MRKHGGKLPGELPSKKKNENCSATEISWRVQKRAESIRLDGTNKKEERPRGRGWAYVHWIAKIKGEGKLSRGILQNPWPPNRDQGKGSVSRKSGKPDRCDATRTRPKNDRTVHEGEVPSNALKRPQQRNRRRSSLN